MAEGAGLAKDDRVLAPTRWTALAIVPVLLAAFVILFGFPDKTKDLWAWTVKPTTTAMLMGGGYLAGVWFFVRVVRAAEGHRALTGLVGVTVFTSMLLLATIIHWDKFNHDHVSFWAWIFLYVVPPLLLPLLWWNNRQTDPAHHTGDLRLLRVPRHDLVAVRRRRAVELPRDPH